MGHWQWGYSHLLYLWRSVICLRYTLATDNNPTLAYLLPKTQVFFILYIKPKWQPDVHSCTWTMWDLIASRFVICFVKLKLAGMFLYCICLLHRVRGLLLISRHSEQVKSIRMIGGIRPFSFTGGWQSYTLLPDTKCYAPAIDSQSRQPLITEDNVTSKACDTQSCLLLISRRLVAVDPKNSVTSGVSNNW